MYSLGQLCAPLFLLYEFGGVYPARTALSLLAFLVGKAAEQRDHELFVWTRHWCSGHTLKHVATAAALALVPLAPLAPLPALGWLAAAFGGERWA